MLAELKPPPALQTRQRNIPCGHQHHHACLSSAENGADDGKKEDSMPECPVPFPKDSDNRPRPDMKGRRREIFPAPSFHIGLPAAA